MCKFFFVGEARRVEDDAPYGWNTITLLLAA